MGAFHFFSKSQTFTANGTFNSPANCRMVALQMIGGGGSGSGANDSSSGVGSGVAGGAGEMALGLLVTVTPSTAYSVVIGAAGIAFGAPPTSGWDTGAAGGASTFNGWSALGAQAFSNLHNWGIGGGCGANTSISDNDPRWWQGQYETTVHCAGPPGSSRGADADDGSIPRFSTELGRFVKGCRAGTAMQWAAIGARGADQPSPFSKGGLPGGGSFYVHGGDGGNFHSNGNAATGYGGGGGGGGNLPNVGTAGGDGKAGIVIVFYN